MPSTSNPWIRDATGGGVINGGDVGGDVQVTDSFSVRFTHRTLPNALVTYTYYGASDDVNEAGPPWHVERQTEFMVCRDPKDPGGTEVWSDLFYGPPSDQAGYPAVAEFTDLAEVKHAAKVAAEAHLQCNETWSGQPPWATEWDTHAAQRPPETMEERRLNEARRAVAARIGEPATDAIEELIGAKIDVVQAEQDRRKSGY